MPRKAPSFSGYCQLDLSCLGQPQSSLPEKVTLTGPVCLLYEVRTPKGQTTPRISILLKVDLSTSAIQRDYILPNGQSGSQQKIRLDILPGPAMIAQMGIDSCKEALLTAFDKLKRGGTKVIQISVGGGTFKGYETSPGAGKQRYAVIECEGDRMVQVEGGEIFTLVLDSPPASSEPPWLSTPSSPPEAEAALPPVKVSKPIPPARSTSNSTPRPAILPNAEATSSKRFQPVTSHRIPLTNFPSDLTNQSGTSGKRRASVSRPAEPAPAKKQKVAQTQEVRQSSAGGRSRTGSNASNRSLASDLERRGSERSEDNVSEGIRGRAMSTHSRTSSASEYIAVAPAQPTPAARPAAVPVRPAAYSSPPRDLPPPIYRSPSPPADPAPAAVIPPAPSAPSQRALRMEAQKQAEAVAKRRAAIAAAAVQHEVSDTQQVISQFDAYRAAQLANSIAAAPHPAPHIASTQITNNRQASVTQISAPMAGAGPSTAIARMSAATQGVAQPIVFTTVSQLPGIIKDRSHSTIVNVAGIVIKVNPPKKIKNWMSTIIITDQTCVGEARTRNDLPVGIFRDAEAELPKFALGTPVLFTNIKVKEQNNKPKIQAFPPDGMHWAYLKDGRVLYSTPGDPPLSPDGEQKLRDLDAWHRQKEGLPPAGSGSGAAPAPAPAFNEKPVTLLRDVSPGFYCKITFKIIRLVDNRRYHETGDRRSPALELYISDGTIHNAHRPYEYHGRDLSYPVGSIARLAIFEPPSEYDMEKVYRVGSIVTLPNVRPEVYNHDALQLIWSDLLTKEQEEKGWRKKRPTLLYHDDPRAIEIERRVQAVRLDGGENPPNYPINSDPPAYASPATRYAADPLPSIAVRPAPAAPAVVPIPQSNQISTTYQDPVKHKCTPLAEVLTNQTVPNRFRVRARVAAIYPISKKDGPLAVKFCKNCNSSFGSDKKHVDRAYCHSCNDVHVRKGELRYRFVMLLTTSTTPNPEDPTLLALDDPSSVLPVLVSDADAESILPALGLLTSTINADPKREKSLQQRLKSAKGEIEKTMMGGLMDMVRERPMVDWCVESYLARPRAGKGSAEGEGVVVYRIFGMVPGPQAGQQPARTELVA